MPTEEPPRDDPFFVFRKGYDAIVWASTLGFVLLTVWLFWTLVINTPPGTTTTQAQLMVQPTLTAMAGSGEAMPEASGAVDAAAAETSFTALGCAACHNLASGTDDGGLTCPPLGAIGSVSLQRLAAADYAGDATTAAEYILESIVEPNAYLVSGPPGTNWVIGGTSSLMPAGLAERLDPAQLDNLVEWLAAKE